MSGLKTLAEVGKEVRRRAVVIRASSVLLPAFGRSEGCARPHIEVDSTAYHLVVVERGREQSRHTTSDFDDLLYQVFHGVTFGLARDYELAHRVERQDCRRILFRRQVELLTQLADSWGHRCAAEQQVILRDHPFDDFAGERAALTGQLQESGLPAGPAAELVPSKVGGKWMQLAAKAEERVRREFFPEDYALAIQILSGWQTKACAPGETPSRMHRAVINLARGNLRDLKWAIASAKSDFRDVLLWGGSSDKPLGIVCKADKGIVLPEEEAFLRSIARDPPANDARLVYADWLEERGDRRADYLRVLCEWLASRSARDQQLIERERELRVGLDRRWLTRIRGMPVREKSEKG
jgi:uncharacterized protein (TIGR02996 family)